MVLYDLINFITGRISFIEFLQFTIFAAIAVVIAMSVHECCHALVSYWFGDNTAKYQGRISLNPFRHMNLIGTIALLLIGFGWANPVMINSRNYKKPRLGTAVTAAAGPVSNLLTSFIFSFLYILIYFKLGLNVSGIFWQNFANLFMYIILINISFAIFNLIPFPPLDGSKIVGEILPLKYRYKYYALERYSMIFFFALIIFLRSFDFLAILNRNIVSFFISASAAMLGI
ncbi:MAG: site-2 protease family protein [Clostridiales bacterium]|nr:MAG: site-2 protease family protein [Clostridiales bacterium]